MTRSRKKSRHKRDSNPGPSTIEADALTTRPTRRSWGGRGLRSKEGRREGEAEDLPGVVDIGWGFGAVQVADALNPVLYGLGVLLRTLKALHHLTQHHQHDVKRAASQVAGSLADLG